MQTVLVLALLAAAVAAGSEAEFRAWAQAHGRVYGSALEEARRLSVYEANAKTVAALNARYHPTTTFALNKFADLTPEEFRATYLSSVPRGPRSAALSEAVLSTVGLPDAVDWVVNGSVTPIKDQGSCGSCYAFGSVGAVEGIWKIKKGTLYNLAEQEIVDCSSKFGNYGCNGGDAPPTYEYLMSVHGMAQTKDYPYVARAQTCKTVAQRVAPITSYTRVTSKSYSQMMAAVAQQPVAVGIDAEDSFQFYSDGVYDPHDCSADLSTLNHEVLVVGYGSEGGKPFWLVKNSWGTGWGLQGYIKFLRSEITNACGILTDAVIPNL
jgi:C1A family cysteine protease